ncbi:hypothetical protein PRUPE_4G076600 [Prunus persica]|uniref:Protein kinase domain-containing protein n=1 Tax=Prunus persica TaxID=3760 RepID=M5WPC3_PRUPE|nr:hypothetical protein PRUPE_4G076600 [Prunus persica]
MKLQYDAEEHHQSNTVPAVIHKRRRPRHLHFTSSIPSQCNILLDDDMVAHVADFGPARLLGGGDSMTLATIGYMAPGRSGFCEQEGLLIIHYVRLALARSAEFPKERMQDVVVTLNKIKIKFLNDCAGVQPLFF